MVKIKLSFNKLERNKKMSLQFINLSSAEENNEFEEDEEIKGKYCKEKLNKIIEKKNYYLYEESESGDIKFKIGCRHCFIDSLTLCL